MANRFTVFTNRGTTERKVSLSPFDFKFEIQVRLSNVENLCARGRTVLPAHWYTDGGEIV